MIAAKNIRTVPLRFAAGKISLPQGSIAEIRLRTGRSACAVMTDGMLCAVQPSGHRRVLP